MNTVITLALKLVKSSFVLIDDKKKVSGKKQVAFLIVLLVLLGPNMALFGYLTYEITTFLLQLHQETVVLALILQFSVIIILFSSIFMVPSYLFYAKDIERLLPLPLSHVQLLCAKLLQIHIYQLGLLLIITLPTLIGFIWAASFTSALLLTVVSLWINAVVTLVIAALVLIGLMSVSPWFKNKDAVTLVFSIFAVGFAIIINLFIGGLDFSNPEAIALSLLAGQQSLSQNFASLLPYLNLSVQLLVQFNWFTFILYVTGSIVSIVLIVKLMAPTLVTIMASFSGTNANKKMSVNVLQSYVARPLFIALLLRELKILLRTPVYFFNNVLVMFILPVILIASFTQSNTAFAVDFATIKEYLHSNPLLVVVIGAGMSAMFSTLNLVTPTSISREGSSKFHLLLWPVPMKTLCYVKFWSGIIISLIGVAPTLIFFILANVLYFQLPFLWLSLSTLSILIIMIFTNLFGLVVDLYNPKLVWENEQAAVKQNINFLFTFLSSSIVIGIMVYALFRFSDIAGWVALILHFLCILAIILFHHIIKTSSLDLLIEH